MIFKYLNPHFTGILIAYCGLCRWSNRRQPDPQTRKLDGIKIFHDGQAFLTLGYHTNIQDKTFFRYV